VTANKTHYEILGVPATASEADIKGAFHRLAKMKHPDKAANPEQKAAMQAEFELITKAYNTLKDSESRASYDASVLKRSGGTAPPPAAGGPPAESPRKSAPGTESSPATVAVGAAGNTGNLDKNRGQAAKRAFLKGLKYLQAGEYLKAAEFIESAIRNNDSDPSFHYKLAQTLRLGKRSFSRAEAAAKRAIELDPYNGEYRLLLGQVYEDVGSTSRAIEVYEEVLKWDPTNERATMALNILKPPKRVSFLDRLFGKK
jgi:curved DNA-binding protein CbpA